MAKTSAIVKRRKAVRNIRKITRTMELIATARFKKALDRAVAAEGYTKRIAKLAGDLGKLGAAAHPLLEARPRPKKALLLVVASNRGLCGGYIANVLKAGRKALADAACPVELEVSGKRGVAYFRHSGFTPAQVHTQFEDKPTFAQVDELATRFLELFRSGAIDRLEVSYTRFVSMSKQVAETVQLLPMAIAAPPKDALAAPAEPAADYEFIPSAADILHELVPTSFKTRLFKCFLDAAVSEQIARMVAMKGATENAGQLIKQLTRNYNRARQAAITSQICEIIGTVEALK